jgi:hypothetical protein
VNAFVSVELQRKVSTWTRKITLVHVDGDDFTRIILFPDYATLFFMYANHLEAIDLRSVLVTTSILSMTGTVSSASLRELAFGSAPAIVFSSIGKFRNLEDLIITITRPASGSYNEHWATLAQMPAWDLPRLRMLDLELTFVEDDHQGLALTPFLARCQFETLRRLATRIIGPVGESEVAIRALTGLFDRNNALEFCQIQAKRDVLTHILAHVGSSYLKLLCVPSAYGVSTLHPAVRTLEVFPSSGFTTIPVRGVVLGLEVVSQASLFELMDGLEARQTRNAHLARVHINAHVSADAEEAELFDGEGPVDFVESDFEFRWHEEHPSEADAFVGRMLSYAFRLRARGISVLDANRWTANGSRDDTDVHAMCKSL